MTRRIVRSDTPAPGLEAIGSLFDNLMPRGVSISELAAAGDRAAAGKRKTRVEQLEQLERELTALLSVSSPHLWRQIRAPLRRLIHRARLELRAADRADLTLE